MRFPKRGFANNNSVGTANNNSVGTAGTTPAFLRGRFRESIRSQCLRSCAWHWRSNNEVIYSSLVEYCCCGTVTVAADATINHVEADHLGSCCCPFIGIRVGRNWHWRSNNEVIYSSLVEYCCCGTVTVAADVTITHVEADDLGHTMMSKE